MLQLIARRACVIVLLEVLGRRRALGWKLQSDVDQETDPERLTFLNLGPDAAMASG